jgi:hypothetical protein
VAERVGAAIAEGGGVLGSPDADGIEDDQHGARHGNPPPD